MEDVRNMEGKIINWEFKEMVDPYRSWVNDPIKRLMMYIIYETASAKHCCPVWREPENEEMCELIDKELILNLKFQHRILR